MALKCKQFTDIPEWAIYALEYGIDEDSSLSDEDKTLINEFIKTNFPKGYSMEVDWDSYTAYCKNPRFGSASGTYMINFFEI